MVVLYMSPRFVEYGGKEWNSGDEISNRGIEPEPCDFGLSLNMVRVYRHTQALAREIMYPCGRYKLQTIRCGNKESRSESKTVAKLNT